MNQSVEIWKDLHGFDRPYQISSSGRVRRIPITIEVKVRKLSFGRALKPKILKHQYRDKKTKGRIGPLVVLVQNNKASLFLVSELMSQYFNDNQEVELPLWNVKKNGVTLSDMWASIRFPTLGG